MDSQTRFEALVAEALQQEFVGWDFSWLHARTVETTLPWDYRQMVLDRLPTTQNMLDMGTGGGEFLSSLGALPAHTCATESYAPNLPLARQRLEPLGVQVADTCASKDRLPYPGESFDLVINRHESFKPAEVFRVLRPGGVFLTQQVGGQNCTDLNRFLQEKHYYIYAHATLERDIRSLEKAGFSIEKGREAMLPWTFLDVGAIIFYLKAIPWQIEDFTVEKYRAGLMRVHQTIEKQGGFTVTEHRTLIEARKPNA